MGTQCDIIIMIFKQKNIDEITYHTFIYTNVKIFINKSIQTAHDCTLSSISHITDITKLCTLIKRSTTGCPTCYQTRHFFNNFTTNEDIATKFEVDLPHCVRNVTTS